MTGDEETMIVTLDVRTIDQACSELKIGRSHFGKLVAYGDIRVIRLSGKTYVTKGELKRVHEDRRAIKAGRGR